MARYYITILCDSDETDPVAHLAVSLKYIAPYMVQNVEVDYGVIRNGVSESASAQHGQPFDNTEGGS